MSDTVSNDVANAKLCLSCASDLRPQASKCPECGTVQNWRRHLPSLAVLFSIILGAGSVFSMAYPVVQELLKKEFDPQATRVGVNAKTYTVLLENRGKAPVAINYVSLFFGSELLFLDIEGGDAVIDAGASRILKFLIPADFERPFDVTFEKDSLEGGTEQMCEILISVIGSGEEEWFTLTEPERDGCWALHDYITGVQSVG